MLASSLDVHLGTYWEVALLTLIANSPMYFILSQKLINFAKLLFILAGKMFFSIYVICQNNL